VIICVSANPAIDCRSRVRRLTPGSIHRARTIERFPGGKAAHVAMAASALGEPVLWVGMLGGSTGAECELGLVARGIAVAVARTECATRMNLELLDDDGTVTEVLEPGGPVTAREIENFLTICDRVFEEQRDSSVVVICGSLPVGAPVTLYAEVMRRAHDRGCRAYVDASGDALQAALAAAPDLVKPNHVEISAARDVRVSTLSDAAIAAEWLIDCGAAGAAVSLGSRGIVWKRDAESKAIYAALPAVTGVSTVGCGDAAMAGFAVARARGLAPAATIALAAACGTANCAATEPGMIDAREVERLVPLVETFEVNALDSRAAADAPSAEAAAGEGNLT